MPYKDATTITISGETKRKLALYKGKEESWGDFLLYLLKFWRKHRK